MLISDLRDTSMQTSGNSKESKQKRSISDSRGRASGIREVEMRKMCGWGNTDVLTPCFSEAKESKPAVERLVLHWRACRGGRLSLWEVVSWAQSGRVPAGIPPRSELQDCPHQSGTQTSWSQLYPSFSFYALSFPHPGARPQAEVESSVLLKEHFCTWEIWGWLEPQCQFLGAGLWNGLSLG